MINIEFPVMRMSKKDGSTEEMRVLVKNIRDEAKGYINSLKSGYCRVNQEKNDELIIKLKGAVSVFVEVTLRFMECYADKKREKNVLDFNDIEHMALGILTVMKDGKTEASPIADEIAGTISEVIVDEYQDISRQRFDLTKALADVTDAKIIAVGDDWQSIYAFSGSDISLFTKFEEKMGYAKMLKIVKTYRNSQEVIDIAGNFIQKNREQITKRLISPKNIKDPVIIYTYDSTRKSPKQNRRSGVNYAIAHAVEIAIEQLLEYKKQE